MIGPYRERAWPRQWIAMCEACSVGIRCNARATAARFMRRYCRHAAESS